MLRGLRKASSNWLGKSILAAVVGFLIISFAIWGIGDIFRGFGRSTVAKIGRIELTVDQFRMLYNDRLQQFARQLGRPISGDQARAMGIDRLVLSQIVAEFLLDERARQLGLALSDAEVSRYITNDPSFRGPNGQFDRFRFEQIIRNAGYTEARYVAEQRRRLMRLELAGTIAQGLNAPKALLAAADRYQNEQRAIEYVLLDRAQAGDIPQPMPEELAKYFDERKIAFRAPEYRKVTIVSLIPSEQAHWIEISDADLKRAYEERRARYATPERRHVLQIDFSSVEAAQAAADRVAKGASFVEVAKELGKTEKDIDLGTVTKSAMIDKAVADAAFSLKEGEVSAPVQGRFGTVLVQVTKVEPEQVRSFEEVAPELKQELATARAKSETLDIYNKLEDARSEGKTLTEAAENLKLPARTIEAVDRSGRDPNGNPVNLPDQQPLLQGIFATDIGIERDPLQFQDGYVWYDVTGITPSRERSLDEVKDQVETRWRDDEIAARLKAKSAELLDKLKAGTPLDAVAASAGVKVQTAEKLTRTKPEPGLPSRVLAAVFRTAKDAFGSSEGDQPTDWVVFRVTDITTPKFDAASPEMKRITELLKKQESDEILEQYLAWLQNDLGTSVNQAALAQALGNSAPDTN